MSRHCATNIIHCVDLLYGNYISLHYEKTVILEFVPIYDGNRLPFFLTLKGTDPTSSFIPTTNQNSASTTVWSCRLFDTTRTTKSHNHHHHHHPIPQTTPDYSLEHAARLRLYHTVDPGIARPKRGWLHSGSRVLDNVRTTYLRRTGKYLRRPISVVVVKSPFWNPKEHIRTPAHNELPAEWLRKFGVRRKCDTIYLRG